MSHRNRIPPLTIGAVRSVLHETGIDLLKIDRAEVGAGLWGDPVLLGRVIAALGGPDELEGDELASAQNELAHCIVEFFPKRSIYDEFIEDKDRESAGQVDPWRLVFRAAGMAGLDPWGYSLREIIWAAQGAYEPFAELLAQQAATGSKNGKAPYSGDTLNPWHPKRPRPKRKRSDAEPSQS